MKNTNIKEGILLFVLYAVGAYMVMYAFIIENTILKVINILFGGILFSLYALKVIYTYYLDNKYDNIFQASGIAGNAKKKRSVDVFRISSNLFLFGLFLVMATLLLAFKTDTSKVEIFEYEIDEILEDVIEDDIPSTTRSIPPPPIPPPPPIKLEVKEIVNPAVINFIPEEIDILKDIDLTVDIPLISEVLDSSFYKQIKDDDIEIKKKLAEEEPEIVDFSEVMPQFKGGSNALFRYFNKNIKYPEIEKEIGNEGTVYVNFVVDKQGMISNVKIKRGLSSLFDREAIRVVKEMPAWEPGLNNGKKVNVYVTIPIKFVLEY